MLLVPTHLGPSSIDGIGLFSSEKIAAGTVVWRHNETVDPRIHRFTHEDMPEPARSSLYHFGWYEGQYLIVPLDNARFINHSDIPNLVSKNLWEVVAVRDIEKDEELTEDYSTFDPDFASYKASKRWP